MMPTTREYSRTSILASTVRVIMVLPSILLRQGVEAVILHRVAFAAAAFECQMLNDVLVHYNFDGLSSRR